AVARPRDHALANLVDGAALDVEAAARLADDRAARLRAPLLVRMAVAGVGRDPSERLIRPALAEVVAVHVEAASGRADQRGALEAPELVRAAVASPHLHAGSVAARLGAVDLQAQAALAHDREPFGWPAMMGDA